jgi:oligosaccharyltransferase complex subunit epsilon
MAPNPTQKEQQLSVLNVVGKLYDDYKVSTPKKIKLVDAYMFCIMLTGIIQFVYCCLVGTFPFNAFLSGFISTVASFVLAGKFSKAFYFNIRI